MSNILNALNQQAQEYEARQNNINQKVRDFDLEKSIKEQGIEQLKNQMGAQKFEAAMGLVPLATRLGEMSGASKYVKGKYDSAKDYVLGKKQDAEENLKNITNDDSPLNKFTSDIKDKKENLQAIADEYKDLSTTVDTTDFDKLSPKKISKLPAIATDEHGIPIFDKPTPEQLKTGIASGRFKVTNEGIQDNLTGGSTKFGLKGGAKFFSPDDLKELGLNIKPGGDIRQEFQRQRDIESGRTYARANQPPKITEDEDKFTMVGEPSEEFKKAFPLSEGSVGTSADLSFRIKNPIQPQEQIKAGEERTNVFRAKGKVIRPEDIAESAPIPEVRGLNLSEKQAPITSELTRDERQRGAYGSGQGTAFERAPIEPEDQSMLNRLESGAQQAQNLTKKSLELPSQQREPTLISKQSLDNIAEKSEPAEEGEEGEVAEKEVAEESGSKLGGATLMGLSALGTIGDSSKSAGQKVGDIGKQVAMFGGIEASEALVPGLGDVALAGTAIYELTHVAHEEKELRQQQEQISQAPAPTGSGGSSGSAPVIDSSSYHIL